jgi:diaminopimelate epimerase
MAPHWAAKLYDGATENAEEREMRVAQVSRRGGELWAIAKKSERKVLLRGEVKVYAQGKLDM